MTVPLGFRLCSGDPCTQLARDADSAFRAGAGTPSQHAPAPRVAAGGWEQPYLPRCTSALPEQF